MPQPIDDDVTRLAETFGLDPRALASPRRSAPLVRARAVVYYLLRGRGYSTHEIAAALRRDHSTVIQMAGRVRDRARSDAATRTLIVLGRRALGQEDAP